MRKVCIFAIFLRISLKNFNIFQELAAAATPNTLRDTGSNIPDLNPPEPKSWVSQWQLNMPKLMRNDYMIFTILNVVLFFLENFLIQICRNFQSVPEWSEYLPPKQASLHSPQLFIQDFADEGVPGAIVGYFFTLEK